MRFAHFAILIVLWGFNAQAETDEPFGVETVPEPHNQFAESWRKVRRDWLVERGMLDQCRANREFCAPAALRFLAIVDKTRIQIGRLRLAYLNRAFNLTIRAADDVTNYGVTEIWTSPLATLANGAGDCTDFAIAKYFALSEVGVPVNDRRLVIVRDKSLSVYHTVLAVRSDQRWLILDNKTLTIVDAADATQYAPVLEFDGRGTRRVVKSERIAKATCSNDDQFSQ